MGFKQQTNKNKNNKFDENGTT